MNEENINDNRINGQVAGKTVDKEAKSSKKKLCSSLNQDEWELFFVVDDDKVKFNQKPDKPDKAKNNKIQSTRKDLNQKEEIDFDLDLEWDDFNDDELDLVFSEENQLIFEKDFK